jgi:hypothetical protein
MIDIKMEWNDSGAIVCSSIPIRCPRCGDQVLAGLKHRCGDRIKNPAAVALGKLRAQRMTHEERSNAGKEGGKARAASLSPKRRREIARRAAAARTAPRHITLKDCDL